MIAILAVAICTAMTSLYPSAVAAVPYVSASDASQARSPKSVKASKVETVVFSTNLHCKNCVKKVNENISFEKGVKDLKVSLEDQTITVTFDPAKTSVETLSKAIARLGYKAELKN